MKSTHKTWRMGETGGDGSGELDGGHDDERRECQRETTRGGEGGRSEEQGDDDEDAEHT